MQTNVLTRQVRNKRGVNRIIG